MSKAHCKEPSSAKNQDAPPSTKIQRRSLGSQEAHSTTPSTSATSPISLITRYRSPSAPSTTISFLKMSPLTLTAIPR